MYRVIAVVALAGCAAGAPPPRALSNASPGGRTGALFDIEADALGPITRDTPANTEALQALLGSRYTVKGIDNRGMEYNVFLGDERLFYVIPNDDGSLFNVHVVSAKVAIAQHPEWVIGAPLSSAEPLTQCECWGRHPVCYHHGEHVAVAFDVDCDGLDTPEQRHRLEGVAIQRAVWSPHAFGAEEPAPPIRAPSPTLERLFEGGTP